jgi:hypothetical protein
MEGSSCFSTAVQDLLLKTRVLTPEGDPNITGAPLGAPASPPRTRAREKSSGPDRSREKKNNCSSPDAAPKRRPTHYMYRVHAQGGWVWKSAAHRDKSRDWDVSKQKWNLC